MVRRQTIGSFVFLIKKKVARDCTSIRGPNFGPSQRFCGFAGALHHFNSRGAVPCFHAPSEPCMGQHRFTTHRFGQFRNKRVYAIFAGIKRQTGRRQCMVLGRQMWQQGAHLSKILLPKHFAQAFWRTGFYHRTVLRYIGVLQFCIHFKAFPSPLDQSICVFGLLACLKGTGICKGALRRLGRFFCEKLRCLFHRCVQKRPFRALSEIGKPRPIRSSVQK